MASIPAQTQRPATYDDRNLFALRVAARREAASRARLVYEELPRQHLAQNKRPPGSAGEAVEVGQILESIAPTRCRPCRVQASMVKNLQPRSDPSVAWRLTIGVWFFIELSTRK